MLESGIGFGIFTLFYILYLQKEKSFSFNRFYLLGSVVLSLVLPFLHFSIQSVPSEIIVGTIFLDPIELNTESEIEFFSNSQVWLYGSVVFVLLIRLPLRTIPLILSRPKNIYSEGYRIGEIENSASAYTFWDTIYLGDLLNQEEKQVILKHEKIHAIEKHSLDILFLEIVGALLWINPLLILIKKLVRTNHEYIADSKAIDESNKDYYIKTLATQTIKSHGFELAHAFHSSSTLKRIKMINQQNKQIMKIKQVMPFVLGLALVLTLGCDDAAEQLSEMNDQQAAEAITNVQTSSVKKSEGIEDVYDMVDVQPLPENGMTSFYQWVAENMLYPTQARKLGVEGRVFVQFIVNEVGEITEVKAIKGIGAGCDAEAVRVMKSASKWTPGQVDGKPVKVRMVMPFSFKLQS